MTERRAFGMVVGLAVAARVAAVLALASHRLPNTTYEHGEIAANLLAGRGFAVLFLGADGPTSQQAPVYPFLVATAYALAGVGTPAALLLVQLVQAALGGLLAAGTIAMAREIAPGRRAVAIGAGLIAAIHPTLVYAATHIQVALIASTLLAWTLARAHRLGRTGRVGDAALVGGLLGLLVLTDPILGLVAPGLAMAVVLGRGTRLAIRPLGVMGLVAVLVVLPWTIRNHRVHGELIAVKSTFGYAFWQGNCALSEGTDKVRRASVDIALRQGGNAGMLDPRRLNAALWDARHEAGYLDDVALTAEDYRTLGQLTEPERSRLLFHRAIDELRATPGRYAALCLRRLRYFVLFDETNPKTRNALYRASHLGLTIAAGLGLWLAPPWLRRRLVPTLITAALVAAFHALTITSARFHIPIEPLLGLWAAAAFARPPRFLARRGKPIGCPLARRSRGEAARSTLP